MRRERLFAELSPRDPAMVLDNERHDKRFQLPLADDSPAADHRPVHANGSTENRRGDRGIQFSVKHLADSVPA